MAKLPREYLGDGLYVEFDGYHVWLITSNGIQDIDRVALDPTVLRNFFEYIDRLKEKVKQT